MDAATLVAARAAVNTLLTETCGLVSPTRTNVNGAWVDSFDDDAEVEYACDVQHRSGVTVESRDRQMPLLQTVIYLPHGTAVAVGDRIRRLATGALYLVSGPTEESGDDLAHEVLVNLIEE